MYESIGGIIGLIVLYYVGIWIFGVIDWIFKVDK